MHHLIERPAADVQHKLRLRLGMPHLGAKGLSENWLLRTAAQLHWDAISLVAGCAPGELRDETGARAMASVVSARIAGDLTAFGEDAPVEIALLQPPSAANGWHSACLVRRTDRGASASVRVELMSRFARRGGASNRQIELAPMTPALRAAPTEAWPTASRVLKARARSLRQAAPPPDAQPITSVPIFAEADLNGVGLLYFANFLRFFEAAESLAMSGPWRLPPSHRREVHWYGNADAGDRLEMNCEVHVAREDASSTTHAFVTARRASDGVLVAACECWRALPRIAH